VFLILVECKLVVRNDGKQFVPTPSTIIQFTITTQKLTTRKNAGKGKGKCGFVYCLVIITPLRRSGNGMHSQGI